MAGKRLKTRPGLVPLTEDQIADARFRAKDRAWAAVAGLFDCKSEQDGLTYQTLADRVGRKKSQVHRWIDCSGNMTLESLGLLAEGLDADLTISLEPFVHAATGSNHCHPATMAAAMCNLNIGSRLSAGRSESYDRKPALQALAFRVEIEEAHG